MHKTGGCSLWLGMRRIIHHTQAFKGLKEQFTPLCSASAVAECCNAFFAVKLQKCGCVDKDYIFIFGWPFPLNLELESNVSLKVRRVNVEFYCRRCAAARLLWLPVCCLPASASLRQPINLRALTVTSFCSWQRGTRSRLHRQTNSAFWINK